MSKRPYRIVLISSVSVGLLLGLTTLVILMSHGGSKVTVSFVNAEASNGQFPSYVPSERLAFAVRNAGSKRASVDVSHIEDEHGKWTRSIHMLGGVEASQSTHVYLYLPVGSRPRRVRVRVSEKASPVQKARYALELLAARASARYSGKQIWFDRLSVPVDEFIVKLEGEAQRDGAANVSQSIRSETNRTSFAAGSSR